MGRRVDVDDLVGAQEIADRLGLGVGTVKRYLSLAVHRMEALLGPVAVPPTDDAVVVQTSLVRKGRTS